VPNLPATLRKRLSGAPRLAVLAVGSRLRGDDAAGLLAADALAAARKSRRRTRLKIFFGETVPENLTGEIRRFRPTHLLLLDAADFGRRAGTVRLIEPEEARSNPSLSTHALPLSILTDYLRDSIGCEVFIIGIQPASSQFDAPPSAAVQRAARRVAAAILKALA
jgi:hydrogenase 3 maturation protease